MKKCLGCSQEKHESEFYTVRQRGKVGLNSQCKACYRIKDSRPATRYSRSRSKARKQGMPWELTLEQYAALIAQPCHYCGGELPPLGTALDRLDTKRGYWPDNVVPACWVCNYTKSDMFYPDEMREIGVLVKRFRAERAGRGREELLPTYFRPKRLRIWKPGQESGFK